MSFTMALSPIVLVFMQPPSENKKGRSTGYRFHGL
jgi:hypothetical protein